jgi:hypothetical protein
MATLVSFRAAKAHLRVDHDFEDADIRDELKEAENIVVDYLKLAVVPAPWLVMVGSPAESSAPFRIKAAIKLVLQSLHERTGEDPLSPAVVSLLMRDRDPTLA